MNSTAIIVVSALLSYLIGSIPFGYLIGLMHGVDIRTLGSGNIGATNVFRTLGRKPGIFTFVLDVMKGVAAVSVVPSAVALCAGAEAPVFTAVLCGAAVMLGHMFPLYLGFKGGKGVATGLGIAIGLAPHTALVALLVWIVAFVVTRYVSVGSCLAALTVAVAPWFLDNDPRLHCIVPALLVLLGTLVIVKHRSNIKRLFAGTENRFAFTAAQRAAREEKNK